MKKVGYPKLHCGKVARLGNDSKTWHEAMSSPEAEKWKEAAIEEFRSLQDTRAIKIIQRSKLPNDCTLMKFKWIFKTKFLAYGSLDKYKARSIVKGFTQRAGLDYKETFAPTPRVEAGRIMMALSHGVGNADTLLRFDRGLAYVET